MNFTLQLRSTDSIFTGVGTTEIGCTITGTAAVNRTCTSGSTATGTLPPGTPIFMQTLLANGTNGGANPGDVYWGITVEPVPAP